MSAVGRTQMQAAMPASDPKRRWMLRPRQGLGVQVLASHSRFPGPAPETTLVPRCGLRYVFDPDNLVVVPYGGRGAGLHPLNFCGGSNFTFALARSFD